MLNASTTPINIEIRRSVRFDFSESRALHHRDNPYLSHFWNSLSVMARSTERILILVARQVRADIRDEHLLGDLDALIAQEALHTRQHRRFNARLVELGYDVDGENAKLDRIFNEYVARVDKADAVALMMAGEHLIYAISHALMADRRVTDGMDEEVRGLLTWHAAEEMEHQSVAHDVYVHLFGDGPAHRLVRARAFAAAARLLLGSLIGLMKRLLATESRRTAAQRREFLRFMTTTPGYGRRFSAQAFRYFRPGFAPWKDPGDLDLIRQTLGPVANSRSALPGGARRPAVRSGGTIKHRCCARSRHPSRDTVTPSPTLLPGVLSSRCRIPEGRCKAR
jgi:predicted metal-dependent hydrolase